VRYIQIQNPRSKLWVKIDRQEGRIVRHKKSPGPFKGITVINRVKGLKDWQSRVENITKRANQIGKVPQL